MALDDSLWLSLLNWLSVASTLGLIARLVVLKLPGVFRLFLASQVADLVTLCLFSAIQSDGSWAQNHLQYRVVYVIYEAVDLVIAVGIFYALLRSFMSSFPGILSLSRRVLWIILSLAVGGALILVLVQVPMDRGIDTQHSDRGSAAPQKEPGVAHAAPRSAARENQVARLVLLTFTIDQTVTTVLLFTLVSMLIFLLWFPIEVPRNTVIFCAGYIIFFTVKSLSLFFRYFYFSPAALQTISSLIQVISAACCLYWLFFLTPAGETSTVRLGHRWKPQEQDRLLSQLGAINTTLLRSARRP